MNKKQEELIFGKWKVGDVLGFNTNGIKYRFSGWDTSTYYNYTGSADDYKVIKSEVYNDEEHLCFYKNANAKHYFMIPKSELINKGILKEEVKDKQMSKQQEKDKLIKELEEFLAFLKGL